MPALAAIGRIHRIYCWRPCGTIGAHRIKCTGFTKILGTWETQRPFRDPQISPNEKILCVQLDYSIEVGIKGAGIVLREGL